MHLSQYFEYEVQSEYINENFVQFENFYIVLLCKVNEDFCIFTVILKLNPMPYFWLHNWLWYFTLVKEFMLTMWDNNLFSLEFWLRPLFYWSPWKAGFECKSQFQPYIAQPLPKMVHKPNQDCPSPNRLLLCLWQWEISEDVIRFWNYLFNWDKQIKWIQNSSKGDNLILV